MTLNEITPVRLELPLVSKDKLEKLVGKYVRHGEAGTPGVYTLVNKINGFSYVGSSISLANRLSTGYFGPKLGLRKIDKAIVDAGLNSFYLELYILPRSMREKLLADNLNLKDYKTKSKQLVLSLEQILLLKINPEYNVLKVAGSPAGLKRSKESMLPSLLKTSKSIYFYDTISKELIFISKSQGSIARLLGHLKGGNLSILRTKNILYLNRFKLTDTPLNEDEYATNLMDEKELQTYVDSVRVARRKELMKQVDTSRQATTLKLSKQVRLINIKTNETLIFPSSPPPPS